MSSYRMSLKATALALLTASATASTLPAHLQNLARAAIYARDPPKALPQQATDDQLKWQPALDFDTDGCYNTPAIDADGNVAEGLDHNYTGGSDECRDPSDLDNNNVYVRSRCNNNWCAHVYAYYFEKDVAVQHVIDAGGHRHDWEHIIVFVEGGSDGQIVAVSQHKDYDTKDSVDVRWDDSTHPKVVYNKDGGTTHCFRFANEDDDAIENAKGTWFRGALVDYGTGFPGNTRDTLMTHDFGGATIAIKDDKIKANIDYARNGGAPGFDSGVDA